MVSFLTTPSRLAILDDPNSLLDLPPTSGRLFAENLTTLFWLAPIAGAALAGVVYPSISGGKKNA